MTATTGKWVPVPPATARATTAREAALETAELVAALPQYRIGGRIGAGGMGVVYEAAHRQLGREVAIKQLPGGHAEDAGMAARFEREARLLAGLDHPHIVPVYDYVAAGHVHLLVMEKLDGGSVWSRLHGDGLTGEQACAIGLAMLAGLHAAHQAGVLHLDVKPKNLLFTAGGVLKVADFGISQVVSEGATLVTRAGEVIGTPAYIAPEQALGNPLTPAADLYAAGTVLYELLSGVLPYPGGGGPLALLHQHAYTDPRPITGVPPALAEVVMGSLARDPRLRYRDAEAFATDLAAAAAQAFGTGWLDRAGLPVHLSPRVATAAATGPARPAVPPSTVRARVPDPPSAVTLADLGRIGLVPASEVLRPPWSARLRRWPAAGAGAAGVALAAYVALASAGAVDPVRPATLDLTVNGVPAAAGVPLDLTEPVLLSGTAPGGPPVVVQLRLSASGVTLGESTSEAPTVADGRWQASLEPPPLARWLAGGAVTGEVRLVRDPATGPVSPRCDISADRAGECHIVANQGAAEDGAGQRFTVRPVQSPLLSAMGAGSVLLMMFALAYLESIMRTVRRRGRSRPGAWPLTAMPVGAAFGTAAALLGAVLHRAEPRPSGLAVAAAIGAVAAALATLARARLRRQVGVPALTS